MSLWTLDRERNLHIRVIPSIRFDHHVFYSIPVLV